MIRWVALVILLIATNAYAIEAPTPFTIDEGDGSSDTLYAHPSGSGSTCSMGSPCSLNEGLSQVGNNETLILQDGTYSQQLVTDHDGASGSHIFIVADNQNMAVIQASAGEQFPVRVRHDYYTFDGLYIDESNKTVGGGNAVRIDQGAHHVVWENGTFFQCGNSCFRIEGQDGPGAEHHIIFRNNLIDGTGYVNETGLRGEGVYVGTSGALSQPGVEDVLIHGNEIRDFISNAFDIKGTARRIWIYDNEIHNCEDEVIDREYTDVDPAHVRDGILLLQGDANYAYRNTFYDCDGSGAMIRSRLSAGTTANLIYNNVAYDIIRNDDMVRCRDSGQSGPQALVFNNTFFNSASHSVDSADCNINVINNIGIDGVANNLATADFTSAYFSDSSGGNFHLTPNATNAIDQVTNTPFAETDFDGDAVINIKDYGAFEHGGDTFYVDNDCETNGDGTSETCGANGPWNTLEAAVETANCSGMAPGDILEIKGGTTYYETQNINPDNACSGIIIQNAAGEAVIFDGTKDISGETWVSIGSGVYECQSAGCATSDEFPFTAWYDTGGGEERLNMIQTNTTCDSSLASGFMQYDPDNDRVCAHLSDSSDPGSATYFRIPDDRAWIIAQTETTDDVTIRKNPSGGSFTIHRYLVNGIEAHTEDNTGWTFSGLTIGWVMNRCLAVFNEAGAAGTTVTNNTIGPCGQEGIRITSDTGACTITGNTIDEIQTSPIYELCNGIGEGCQSGFSDNGAAIRLTNSSTGCTVSDNTITDFGGGRSGRANGINLENNSENNTVDANYIARGSGLAIAGRGIVISGSFAGDQHSGNLIKNNRIVDVDYCISVDLGADFPSGAGDTNFIYNNTCYNPSTYGLVAETNAGVDQDGLFRVRNNLFLADTGTPVLISIPSSLTTGWTDFFNNGFECDSCTTDQDIISYQGTGFERDGDCTVTDCVDQFENNNVYGNMELATSGEAPTLNILSTLSAAADSGMTLNLVSVDYLDTERPQGSGFDIGAHELEQEVSSVFLYGPEAEDCYTSVQGSNAALIIVPDDDDLEDAVENNTNRTILVRAGTYSVPNLDINDDNFVAPYDCATVTIVMQGANNNDFTNNDWTMAGFHIDCDAVSNAVCVRLQGDRFIFRNNFVFQGDTALVVGANSNVTDGLVEGNIIEAHCGNEDIRDLFKPTALLTDTIVRNNWIRGCNTNSGSGNDLLSFNEIDGGSGFIFTNNLITTHFNLEEMLDVKNNTVPFEFSYNTFIGPLSGTQNNAQNGQLPGMALGDGPNDVDCHENQNPPNCPQHHFHHNYFKNVYTADTLPANNIAGCAWRISASRSVSALLEFNIDDNDRNTAGFACLNREFSSVVTRHNTFYKMAWEFSGKACTRTIAGGPVFDFSDNIMHDAFIDDRCNSADDWSVTDNNFSDLNGPGWDNDNLGSGNTTDTISFGSTNDASPDFTVLGGTHSQKGALPVPTISSASINNSCILSIVMSPYNDLHNHGPMSSVDTSKITVDYDSVAQTISGSSITGNTLQINMASCPASGSVVVTFDATHGWCEDSANVGSSFAELANAVSAPALMRAKCLAVTSESVTNNSTGGPGPGPGTFYVDGSCETNGDGTTETCGANGPWNTLEAAIVTDSCSGMSPGDTLEIKGGTYRETESLAPAVACSGITVTNASGEDVIFDGTVDISGEGWSSIGSGVYESSYDYGTDEFPFTAWYDTGGGEERLNLVQTTQTCDATLDAGTMRYNPNTHAVCARLSDDSNPASASYFYVPQQDAFIRHQGSDVDNITYEVHSGGGSFVVQRYSERGFSGHHEDNQGIVIDGLDIGWMYSSCVTWTSGPNVSALTVKNSTIHHCGNQGIRTIGDTGAGVITGNTITDIQTSPIFENCLGIGSGCLGNLWQQGAGIRLNNRSGLGYDVSENTILRVGGGYDGTAYGIWIDGFTQNNVVDSNYIAHLDGIPGVGYGIAQVGASANEFHNDNIYKNNRIYDTDVCYAHIYSVSFQTETGETVSFWNNSCVDFVDAGIQLTISGNADDTGVVSLQNNIFADYSNAPLLVNIPATNSNGWGNIKNNVFYCDGCSGTVISYKGTTYGSTGSGFEVEDDAIEDNVFSDPAVTVSGGDEPTLNIDSNSDAFDVGLTLGTVTDDYAGTSRPQGAGFDIGAHETTDVAASFDIEQESYIFYGRYSSEGSNALGAQNVDIDAYTRGFFTLRFNIAVSSGDAPTKSLALFARLCDPSCGSWTAVDTSSSSALGVYIADDPGRTNRSATTNQITLDGRTFVAGLFVDADASAVSTTLNSGEQTEMEFSLGISTGASAGDTIELRMEESDGTDLDTYTATPTVSVLTGRSNPVGSGIRE